VSSGFATFVTSVGAFAAYQAKGSYPLSADVSSFYALKSAIPSVAGYATSADVSSAHATFATSTAAAAAYQPKGFYPTSSDVSSFYTLKTTDALKAVSADVSSFYALKTSLPSIAGLANSSDVSSGFATFATSISAAAAYQAKGSYPTSADVSSFYALKTSLPSVAGFANSSDVSSFYALKTSLPSVAGFANSSDVSSANATFAKSTDVGSSYARYMGGMFVYSAAAPASIAVANSVGWLQIVTSTTITSAFVTMPQSPFDGQEFGFGSIGIVTFMTQTVCTGSTQILFSKVAALAAGAAANWKWSVASKSWYRVQ
jgi:hypothetical protein